MVYAFIEWSKYIESGELSFMFIVAICLLGWIEGSDQLEKYYEGKKK